MPISKKKKKKIMGGKVIVAKAIGVFILYIETAEFGNELYTTQSQLCKVFSQLIGEMLINPLPICPTNLMSYIMSILPCYILKNKSVQTEERLFRASWSRIH